MIYSGLDEKDKQILQLLLKNARTSYSDIGERVGLSRTAVKNRILALEESGIIQGYEARLCPQQSPEMTTFVVNIETRPECFEEAKMLFANSQQVLTLLQTTGNCHMVALRMAENIAAMRNFLQKLYKAVTGILSINAHSVIDVIKGTVAPQNCDFEVHENDGTRTTDAI